MATQNLSVDDDGLAAPEVGSWAETKYRLLALYDELFSTGMKHKWDQRIYIDLYAGAGHSRVRGTRKFLKGSPILAVTVTHPFDRYIFCEESAQLLQALQARVDRLAPGLKAAYVAGRCDSEVDQICNNIPRASPSNRVLSLCVVDPFDFGLKFSTLKKLSAFYVDFVVLLAIGMDANRNYEHYVEGHSTKIDEALGNTAWRDRWRTAGSKRSDFRRFLAEEFALTMMSLGYLKKPTDRMKLVRSDEKNLPLYYMALFSRSETAHKFWEEVLKYGEDQIGFDWGNP